MEIFFLLILLGLGGTLAQRFISYKVSQDFPEPPPLTSQPLLPTRNRINRQKLLNPPQEHSYLEQSTEESYNVPMDILPDDEIIPPPRDIQGINGE